MNLKVLCYGEVVIDLIRKKDSDSLIYKIGGAPLNVAVGLRRLGVNSAFVSSVGADWFGKIALSYLNSNGIKNFVEAKPEHTTRTAIILHDSRNERSFEFSPGIAAENFLPIHKLELAERFNPDVFYFGSFPFAKGDSLPAFGRFVEDMRSDGVSTVFDPNLRPGIFSSLSDIRKICRRLAALSDIVRLNVDELLLLMPVSNGAGHQKPRIERAAAGLAKLGPKGIFVTDGKDGSHLYTEDEVQFCPSVKVKVVDTTGCGDAFTAALIKEYFGKDEKSCRRVGDILRWSNAAGALAATKLGGADSMPAKAQIERFVKSQLRGGGNCKKKISFTVKSRGNSDYFSTKTKREDYLNATP